MKLLSLATCVLAVAACSSDTGQVSKCEAQLKDKLKSPASYKRIAVDTIQIGPEIRNPPYDEVDITYDAANSFNALLRDKESCFFRPGTTNQFNPYPTADIVTTDMNDTAMDATDMNATDMNATDMNATDISSGDADTSDDTDMPSDNPPPDETVVAPESAVPDSGPTPDDDFSNSVNSTLNNIDINSA